MTQPREDDTSRVHHDEENPATPSTLPTQNGRQVRLARDLEAAGLV